MERFDPSGNLPEQIRVSLGSAIVLGLAEARVDAAPTTVYLMTYHPEKCTANCGFCPQARESTTRVDMLSRVSWPAYRTLEVQKGIADAARGGRIRRVCIQALNYPQVFTDLCAISQTISQSARVPISVSCQPYNIKNMRQLANVGVERIGIPLDAATKELFDCVKGVGARGPYHWERQWELLKNAKKVFGEGRVSTHLIVGLGETDKEMMRTIQRCADMPVLPALFAFTPIRGTSLGNGKQPQISRYRRIQIARHIILHGIMRYEDMRFDKNGFITDFGIRGVTLAKIIQTGEPFLTSGCPSCNRPFYNEKPSGPIYNFSRGLTPEEVSAAEKQLSREQEA